MKLSNRIILITIIPLITSTIIASIVILGISNEQLFESTISQIKSLCQLTESEMRNPMNHLDVDHLNEIVDNLEEDSNILQVLILFPDGRLLTDGTDYDYNYGTTFEDEFIQSMINSDEEKMQFSESMIRAAKPIVLNEIIGILVIDYSTNEINMNIQKSIYNVIGIITIITSISIIIAIVLSRSISKPILQIEKNLKNISGGISSEKIETNIPEIQNLSQKIIEMNNEIENYQKELVKNERLSTIGEMSARITHDLRNPLTAIVNAIEVMKLKKPEMVKENQQYFDMMEDAILRMNHQVDEVLGFVKTREPKREIIKISKIISDTLESIEIPDNIKIKNEKYENLIWCDKLQIQNVLTNLINNAIHAIEKKKGEIEIIFNEEINRNIISIQDNGPGIPEKSIEQIFEPLYTTKQTGTGLGLVTCRNIIEAHKGKIYAQNLENGGAKFVIELPKMAEKN